VTTPAIVLELLQARAGTYRRPCPDCDKGPRDVALSIKVDAQGACWICHRCHATGAVSRNPAQSRTGFIPSSPRENLRRVWRESVPLDHPIAEPARAYLIGRGLGDVASYPPAVLRCHPRLEYFGPDEGTSTHPALLATVTDRNGEAVSLHRTYLAADGSGKAPVAQPKKLMPPIEKGACSRAAIRLHPISRDGVLAVGEGIETSLSYWTLTRVPTWSCISAGGLARFWIPDGVKELHIIEDIDPSGAGQDAAMALWKRAATRWRRAVFISPDMIGADPALIPALVDRYVERGRDLNDVLRVVRK
jgi:putative DNA primase/helicase